MTTENDHIEPDWSDYIDYAKTLTKDQMVIREKVVAEYLYDYSWTNACLRCGFRPEFASDHGLRFSQDPYVRWRLKEVARQKGLNATREDSTDLLDAEKVDVINALKKEAHYYGPGSSQSARVAALAQLAKLYGMEPAKQVKAEVKTQSVMVVPGIANVDAWEETAMAAQQKLQEDTMNGIAKNVH